MLGYASNIAGTERFTVQVTVNVPPKWILQPKDSSVQAGEDISLHCQADGWPKPIVAWSKYENSEMRTIYIYGYLTFVQLTIHCIRIFLFTCGKCAKGKAIGATPGEYKEFLYEPNVSLYGNGSLHFKKITKEAQGQYLCEAKNNIGAGVSKVIFLKVNGKVVLLLLLLFIHIIEIPHGCTF